MEKIILQFLKSIHIAVVLNKQIFTGLLNVLYMNFIGKDDMFYSFMIAYNETQVFAKPAIYLGLRDSSESPSIEDLLANNLRSFSNKAAWNEGKWDINVAKNFSKYIENKLDVNRYAGIRCGQYAVKYAELWSKPALGITIFYSKGDSYHNVITIWLGSKTVVSDSDIEFLQFLEALGISNYVIVDNSTDSICPDIEAF